MWRFGQASDALGRAKVLAAATSGLLASACASPDLTFRWTLTLATPTGDVTRSSIVRLAAHKYGFPIDATNIDICGSGILFDLGGRGILIAALQNERDPGPYKVGLPNLVPYYLGDEPRRYGWIDQPLAKIASFRGTVNVDATNAPLFIYVPNPNVADPLSTDFARRLAANQLDQVEPGLRVVAETLNTVSTSPTRHLAPRQPWFDYVRHYSGPPRFHIPNFYADELEACI